MQSCAVIGCGPAGMAASAALRQSGLLVTCFDIAPEPGGIWATNARDVFSSRGCLSPIYPSMRCVLPKELMAFSDVRFDYPVAQFPHHTAVQHYMHQYASQKGVRGLTRFNTKVESVRFAAAERLWKLITVNVVNGDVMEWSFDRVCVCTGQTQEVRFPAGLREALSGYTREGGEVHHAAHVKDFRAFRGKRVVVVGDGVTAYDYCVELKRMGAEVVHSTTVQPHSGAAPPTFTSALWKDAAGGAAPRGGGRGLRRGGRGAAGGASTGQAAVDVATRAAGFLARLPWWRHDVHAANDAIHAWLRYRNARLEDIRTVGLPLDSDGRGLRFAADATVRPTTAALVAAARERAQLGTATTAPAAPADVFIDNVDAVICATGYTRRYPFLHPDMRRVLEEDTPLLTTSAAAGAPASAPAAGGRHGLYLGTLWAAEPSLAFVGHQRELLPPFLVFEAQARLSAYAFTQRVSLPDGAAAMTAREDALVKESPMLADLARDGGLGLHSAAYYNVLQHELGVSSRDTYTAKVLQRRRWFMMSTVVRVYHKFRSLAPLKRKKQHVLFSNQI